MALEVPINKLLRLAIAIKGKVVGVTVSKTQSMLMFRMSYEV